MNSNLIMAYNYIRLAKEQLQAANECLVLDTALHEADVLLNGVKDDMELEANGQNIRSNVIKVNFSV